jgi:hypothetical protein
LVSLRRNHSATLRQAAGWRGTPSP